MESWSSNSLVGGCHGKMIACPVGRVNFFFGLRGVSLNASRPPPERKSGSIPLLRVLPINAEPIARCGITARAHEDQGVVLAPERTAGQRAFPNTAEECLDRIADLLRLARVRRPIVIANQQVADTLLGARKLPGQEYPAPEAMADPRDNLIDEPASTSAAAKASTPEPSERRTRRRTT